MTAVGKRGEDHHKAKLTWAQVEVIRKDARLLKQVAPDYGVSISTIHRIRSGRGWKQ